MLRLIRRATVLLLIVGLIVAAPFSVAVYASDNYLNFQGLSANEVRGMDYQIISRDNQSSVLMLAIHGGKIEKGTSELADFVSALGKYNFYAFLGIKSKNNTSLHVTSVNFNEPIARNLTAKSKWTISVHGCSGEDKTTYLGGLDTELGKKIQKSLSEAGFVVKPATTGLQGIELQNITNSNLSGKGVQLELSRGLRDTFFTASGAKSTTFDIYARAVNAAIEAHTISEL